MGQYSGDIGTMLQLYPALAGIAQASKKEHQPKWEPVTVPKSALGDPKAMTKAVESEMIRRILTNGINMGGMNRNPPGPFAAGGAMTGIMPLLGKMIAGKGSSAILDAIMGKGGGTPETTDQGVFPDYSMGPMTENYGDPLMEYYGSNMPQVNFAADPNLSFLNSDTQIPYLPLGE